MARRQNGGGASKAGGRGRGSGVHSGHHRRQVNTEIAHATDAGPMYIALSRREREAIQELNDGRVSTQLTSTLHALPQAREKGSVPTACVTTGLGAGTTSTTVPKQLGGGAGATDPGCASVGQDGRPPTSDSPSSDVGLTLRAEFEKQQKSSGWVAMQPARAALPVASTRGELLGEIARCDVTIVSGGTGCGKSTQVPQFILDDLLASGRGDSASIVCTQPRRIAAVGVASRVADERGEIIGGAVGYSIRLDSKRSAVTRLLFCTVGVLLRRLQSDPDLNNGGGGGAAAVTHIVIDEVHERSCDNDLLLSVVRVLLGRRKIKVVLMSATLAVDTLTMYFAEAGCTIGAVSIVGHTFPVDRLYLSDAIELSGYTCPTGSATGFSRPEVTEAVLRERNGTGPTDDDRGTVEAAAEQPPAIADAPMTIGQRMIVENLAARSAKERRVKENSAVGVGSIGGIAQAWIDRVGQAGMREYDQRLKKASNRTLDTLRTLDHSLNPVNTDLITALIRWLVTSSNSKGSTKSNPGTGTFGKAYDGAVLIFMPGLFEILDLVAALQRDSVLGKDSSFLILPLHSELSTEEQKRVFVRPPPGFTKIVVATNIAEASITIDDVTCVIDGGGHKEVRYDPHTSLTSLRLVRIAETNATQRAGRAGRVRAGVCFHLYMRREVLEPQQQPEVQRSPLEPLCLRAKALGLGGIKAALAALPTPPKLGAVDHAMRVLTGLQLIEPCASTTVEAAVDPTQWTQETLSPLGSVLASLPASPRAGKVAVLGAVFGCLEPMLVIAAALDGQSVFAAPRTHHESANRAKRELDPTSDHIAVLKAYRTWSRIRARGSGGEEKRYLSEMFLSRQGMCGIEKTSKQLRAALRSAGLVPKEGGLERHSDNMAFIKALLASSVYPGVATVTTSRHAAREPGTPPTLALRTAELYGKKPVRKQLNNKVVYLHPSTVLSGSQAHIVGRVLAESKDSMAPRPLIAFSSRMKTTRDFVSDATLIGPMELLLFAGLDVVVESSDTADDCDDGGEDAVAASTRSAADEAADTEVHVTLDRWLQFRLSSRNADLLLRLRYDLADVMRQKLGGVVGICNAAGELASRVIAVAARILQTTGVGDDDTGWPLPEGWRHEDDPTSSIGRLLYFNTISGAAQRERPTAPAQRGVGTRSGAPAAQSRGAAHKPNQSHRNKANSASVELSAEDLVAKAQAKEVADSGERDAKAAKAQAAAGRKIQEDAAAATAAVNSKAEAEANKSATLRLAREHEAAVATSASQRHTTVANLLAHLELEHYAEKFAAANIDDATLCDLIDFVEDDADEAAGELDAMIESVGAKGGAAVRLRKAMLSKNPAGGGGGGKGRGGQGRGGLGGRGNGGGRGRNNRGRGRQESGKKKK